MGTYRHADGDSPHLAKDFAPSGAEATALVYPGVAVPGVCLVQNLGQERGGGACRMGNNGSKF